LKGEKWWRRWVCGEMFVSVYWVVWIRSGSVNLPSVLIL